jgi:DNA-binding HxlR family transcriptional regulator
MSSNARAPQASTIPYGSELALDLVNDKWTLPLFKALRQGHNRYGALLRAMPGITRKMLTQTLRKMERDGLIVRVDYGEMPLRVEYHISQVGEALLSRLCSLCEWTKAFFADVESARQRYDGQDQEASA